MTAHSLVSGVKLMLNENKNCFSQITTGIQQKSHMTLVHFEQSFQKLTLVYVGSLDL